MNVIIALPYLTCARRMCDPSQLCALAKKLGDYPGAAATVINALSGLAQAQCLHLRGELLKAANAQLSGCGTRHSSMNTQCVTCWTTCHRIAHAYAVCHAVNGQRPYMHTHTHTRVHSCTTTFDPCMHACTQTGQLGMSHYNVPASTARGASSGMSAFLRTIRCSSRVRVLDM